MRVVVDDVLVFFFSSILINKKLHTLALLWLSLPAEKLELNQPLSLCIW